MSACRTIPLTRGQVALVDAADFDLVADRRWSAMTARAGFYAVSGSGSRPGGLVMMHRLILGASKGVQVDHINRDKLDNRRANLRLCTHAENRWNVGLSVKNTSGFKGVSRHSKNAVWIASILADGVKRNLGSFAQIEEAARAYDAAARAHFGEFAFLNFADPSNDNHSLSSSNTA